MSSEKQKMIKGELYNPQEDNLVKERQNAKLLCYRYNNTSPELSNLRYEILKNLLGKISGKIVIEPSFQCDYGYNIECGENFYSNHNLVILDPAPVKFGKNVFIGPNCGFYTAEHLIAAAERNLGLEYARPITVGDNVWIGGSVTVIGGVTIGDNVVIGAGSVVIKDIPSNTVSAGNPCRVIKML